jgi:hypothetical protein
MLGPGDLYTKQSSPLNSGFSSISALISQKNHTLTKVTTSSFDTRSNPINQGSF